MEDLNFGKLVPSIIYHVDDVGVSQLLWDSGAI